jgi:hypothetical protein
MAMQAKPVTKKDADGQIIKVYPSARKAAENNFMSCQTITNYCNRRTKRALAPDGFRYEWGGNKADGN